MWTLRFLSLSWSASNGISLYFVDPGSSDPFRHCLEEEKHNWIPLFLVGQCWVYGNSVTTSVIAAKEWEIEIYCTPADKSFPTNIRSVYTGTDLIISHKNVIDHLISTTVLYIHMSGYYCVIDILHPWKELLKKLAMLPGQMGYCTTRGRNRKYFRFFSHCYKCRRKMTLKFLRFFLIIL